MQSPRFVPPELAILVDHAPVGEGWLHEIKLDGYRMAIRRGSRPAAALTGPYVSRATAAGKLEARTTYPDGEAVVLGDQEISRSGALQETLSAAADAAPPADPGWIPKRPATPSAPCFLAGSAGGDHCLEAGAVSYLTGSNFKVIMKWNRSTYFDVSVRLLADRRTEIIVVRYIFV